MKNKYLLEKDELPDEKELEKLSEKERKSFFMALLKKQKKQTEQADEKEPAEEVASAKEKAPENAEHEKNKETDAKGSEEAAIKRLAEDNRYAGFSERLGDIKAFIAAFPALDALDAEVRYELAYLAILGSDKLKNANKTPSPAELVEALVENREAVKLYESVRTAQLAEKNGAIPTHIASKGAASMPANIKNSPKNLNEARKEAYGYFGINY